MGPTRQLEIKFKVSHGGARRGAGRPRLKNGRVRHGRRDRVTARTPVHLTIRLRPGLIHLRSGARLKAFAQAVRCARRHGLMIQHFSLQQNHAHFIAEAVNNQALSKGMQSLSVSFARALNKMMGFDGDARRGAVFIGRYHLHVLKTPREVKNALRYVLSNTAKHERVKPFLDRFSSGYFFRNWREVFGVGVEARISRGLEEPPLWCHALEAFLSPPQSWLLKEGWKRS